MSRQSKLNKLIVSCAVALLAFAQSPVLAASLHFQQSDAGAPAGLNGQIPVNRVGGIAIPRGRLRLIGTAATLSTIPEFQFDRVPVLTGTLLKASLTGAGSKSSVNGIIYFLSGEWITYLDKHETPDVITTAQGAVTGKITDITEGGLEFRTADGKVSSIKATDIQDIRSPRVLSFTMPLKPGTPIPSGTNFDAQVTEAILRPVSKQTRISALKRAPGMEKDGDLSNAEIILIGSAWTMLNVAQILPVIIVPTDRRHLLRQADQRTISAGQAPFQQQR